MVLTGSSELASWLGYLMIPLRFWLQAGLLGGSALLNALSGGNKNKQNQQSKFSTTESGSSSNTGTVSDFSFQQGTEDPLLGDARAGGLSRLLGLIEENDKPIYGDNEIASVLNSLNDVFAQGSSNIASQLASVGGLDSGRLATAVGQNEQARSSQVGNFFLQLPSLERQAKTQNLGGLLGQLLNFTGRGPQGQVSNSVRDINTLTETTGTRSGTSNTTGTSQQGGGFWGNLAGGGASILLDILTNGGQKGLGDIFGGGGSGGYELT